MNTEDLFKIITSAPLWYVGHLSKQMASYFITSHTKGKLTLRGYMSLFEKFGYYANIEQPKWVKIEDK